MPAYNKATAIHEAAHALLHHIIANNLVFLLKINFAKKSKYSGMCYYYVRKSKNRLDYINNILACMIGVVETFGTTTLAGAKTKANKSKKRKVKKYFKDSFNDYSVAREVLSDLIVFESNHKLTRSNSQVLHICYDLCYEFLYNAKYKKFHEAIDVVASILAYKGVVDGKEFKNIMKLLKIKR